MVREILELAFQNKIVHIIGKGPSLDELSVTHIKTSEPIIALNEAIYQCELKLAHKNMFWLQQDAAIGMLTPSRSIGIVSMYAAQDYDPTRILLYWPEDLDCTTETLSACMAIKIAKICNASGVMMHCFDACQEGSTRYAECIGKEPEQFGNPDSRFLTHREEIIKASDGIPLFWSIKGMVKI